MIGIGGASTLALLFFNVGVEIGQLLFVAVVLALLTVVRLGLKVTRSSPAYLAGERAIVYAVGIVASYWFIERSAAIIA